MTSNDNNGQDLTAEYMRTRFRPELEAMTLDQRAEFVDRLRHATHLPQAAREIAEDVAMEVTITQALRESLPKRPATEETAASLQASKPEPEPVKDIDTKDVAKLLRKRLRAQFPGVKFSVRMATGTAYGWLDVSWEDGPTVGQVEAITSYYQGSNFNGMTDGYDRCDNQLVTFEGEDFPTEVRFSCCGINTHRTMGPAGMAHVSETVEEASPGLVQTRTSHSGAVVFADVEVPEEIANKLGVRNDRSPFYLYDAAHQMHYRTDYTNPEKP